MRAQERRELLGAIRRLRDLSRACSLVGLDNIAHSLLSIRLTVLEHVRRNTGGRSAGLLGIATSATAYDLRPPKRGGRS